MCMCVCLIECFFGINAHVALNRNPGMQKQYPTLMIEPRRTLKVNVPIDSSTIYQAF